MPEGRIVVILASAAIELEKAGKYTAKVRPHDAVTWKAINLGPVQLKKKG